MRLVEIKKLVAGTADPAFALDATGIVAAWNSAAEGLFGFGEPDAVGKTCSEVVGGIDECGRECSRDCTVQHKVRVRQPLKSYDIQIRGNGRPQWVNVSVMIVEGTRSTDGYSIHIVRPADMHKRFELLVRDFVLNETDLPEVHVNQLMAAKRTPTNYTELSKRETEILRHLAKGENSTRIAESLFISRTTVNNHVQHILKKLGAHNRLEAVRRAEQAGLV